jgi:hypothetical protein
VKAKERRIVIRKKKFLAVVFYVFLVLFLAGTIYLGYISLVSVVQSGDPYSNPSSKPKAAIIDQLSLTYPNQTFVQTTKKLFQDAGYNVEYIPGENVTVNYFRNLPIYNYSIIILRTHSGISHEMKQISIFTSEEYSLSKYTSDQIALNVGRAIYANSSPDQDPSYFSIPPRFIERAMKGNFNDTAIIMMGCYGLEYSSMAEAFINKGAKVYVGWNGTVSADHTDAATSTLLKQLILEQHTIEQAVDNVMNETGPDPAYGSKLAYYPSEAKEQTIQNLKTNTNESAPVAASSPRISTEGNKQDIANVLNFEATMIKKHATDLLSNLDKAAFNLADSKQILMKKYEQLYKTN